MKKDQHLVLGLYKGEGFCPKKDHTLILSGRIDGNTLSTDPVSQTSDPYFGTEVSWEVDYQTLRRYKLSRVPIRVECKSHDKTNASQSLGYIILSLTSVVQGIETDPKWHKLLGGNLKGSKVSPQLLLSLNLYPVNSDAEVEDESARMLHNGGVRGGSNTMNSHHITHQNGTSHTFPDANMNSHLALSQQEAFHMAEFGTATKLGALLSDRSPLLNISPSQRDYSTLPSEVENKGKEEFGSPRDYENEFSQSEHIDLDEDSDDMFKIEEVYTEQTDKELSSRERVHNTRDVRGNMDISGTTASSESVRRNEFLGCNGQVDHKGKVTPTSPVDKVRSLLDGCTNGGNILESREQKEDLDADDIYAGLDDECVDSGFQSRFSGKVPDGCPTKSDQAKPGPSRGTHSINQKLYGARRLSDPKLDATGNKQKNIPGGTMKGGKTFSATAQHSAAASDYLLPKLNHEEGFIRIGPAGSPEEESFEFAVTIVYAKNLDQLLPRDFEWSAKRPTCFSFSLMGSLITSDPIRDICNPDLLAERVAGNIRTTASNLSAYFKQNQDFPIHLRIGDLCLASTSVNLTRFQDLNGQFNNQQPITVEGAYQLVSVVSESKEIVPGREPFIYVVMQLGRQPETEQRSHHIPPLLSNSESSDSEVNLNSYSQHRNRRHRMSKVKLLGSKYDNMSMSSFSSEEDLLPPGKKRRGMNSRSLHHKKNSVLSEGDLRRQLYQAAIEVESWKEEQQAIFLKQWSVREAELQRHLSDEWMTRVEAMESNLHYRLAQSDALKSKLNSGLSELSSRKKKLSLKEEKVRKLLEHLEIQKQEQDEKERETFEGRLKQKEREENNSLLEELKMEKKMRKKLEDEVDELRAAMEQLELPPHQQQHEMKKKIFTLQRDKEMLSDELATALKKKQYYKGVWVRTVNELHNLKKSYTYDMEMLRSEIDMSSPEPIYIQPQHHHRRHRLRSHTVDGGERRRKKIPSGRESGRGSEAFQVKALESQRMEENANAEAGCSWMDQPSSREARSQAEPRVSGLSRSRTESERTIEMGKGRRKSIGNSSEYGELMGEKVNENCDKMRKEYSMWKRPEN